MHLHIGIDDTDSPWGMCTTYLGAVLVRELARRESKFIDFPYLVRLNPNVPFKTRGNAAIALHLDVNDIDAVVKLVEDYLGKLSHSHGKTDPTAVLVMGSVEALRTIYRRALVELVPPHIVYRALKEVDAIVLGGSKGRGIVGAAASVGAFGIEAYSYELLLYRDPGETSSGSRGIDGDVIEIDRLTRPLLFANVDYSSNRALATPRGPDPVIAGLRSFNPMLLSSLAPRLAQRWKAHLAIIYKTNQNTGSHLSIEKAVNDLRPYDSATVRGIVRDKVTILPGGHILFTLEDDTGLITCAVYRETGALTRIARLLQRGDEVEVGGGVQPRLRGLTLNVEYIRVLRPRVASITKNPLCPLCGKRLKSSGRGKGYKCPRCGYRAPTAGKDTVTLPRHLEPGIYLQSPSAYRHLSPPREALGSSPVPAPPLPQLFIWPLLA